MAYLLFLKKPQNLKLSSVALNGLNQLLLRSESFYFFLPKPFSTMYLSDEVAIQERVYKRKCHLIKSCAPVIGH